MAILHSLGINHTIFFQFGIFVVTFIILSMVVFKSYTDALYERDNRTKGGESLANELLKQASDLKSQYEIKVREVSASVKSIFDSKRAEGAAEYDRSVQSAKQEAQTIIENSRAKIRGELDKAAKDLKGSTSEVANIITQQLLKNG